MREFAMLEFYRVGASYQDVLDDMKVLLNQLAKQTLPFEEKSFREAFLQTTDIDLSKHSTESSLRQMIKHTRCIQISDEDDWETMVMKAWVEKVEPSFPDEKLTVIRDYLIEFCALAKVDREKNITERFEIYWQGMELCNGCSELTDLEEMNQRYEKFSRDRIKEGKKPHPIPDRFYESLRKELPESAGVAVGLDRLFHALSLVRE